LKVIDQVFGNLLPIMSRGERGAYQKVLVEKIESRDNKKEGFELRKKPGPILSGQPDFRQCESLPLY